jgi:hypothetical protein
MEQRLSMVTLGVWDLEKSLEFYKNMLGWNAATSPPGIAFFDLNGLVFAQYPYDELAKDMGADTPPDGAFTSQGFGLAHNVRTREEVDTIFARLSAKGATIVKKPEEAFWGGYSGYFRDLDGHGWEVAYNPFWPLDENGRIALELAGTDGPEK